MTVNIAMTSDILQVKKIIRMAVFLIFALGVLFLNACGSGAYSAETYGDGNNITDDAAYYPPPMPESDFFQDMRNDEPALTLEAATLPSQEIDIRNIMQAAEDLLVTMPTIFSLGFGVDSGALMSYAPDDVIGWHWFDHYGNPMYERMDFLRLGLVPRHFVLLDLDGEDIPSIFVKYEGLHIGSHAGILFRYYNGEFRQTRGIQHPWSHHGMNEYYFLATDRFYKDSQGDIIVRINDDYYGLRNYLSIHFNNYRIEPRFAFMQHMINIIDGFAYFHETLTPIMPMTELEEELTAAVRSRLGIADAPPITPAPHIVQAWPVWDAPPPECDDSLAHALHAAKVFLSDYLTIFAALPWFESDRLLQQGLFFPSVNDGRHGLYTGTQWFDLRGNAISKPPGSFSGGITAFFCNVRLRWRWHTGDYAL